MRTAFALLCLLLTAALGAQSYTVTYGHQSYNPLGASATRLSFSSDDELSTTLGFPGSGFTFFGQTYTKLEVCTNGFILLGGGGSYNKPTPDYVNCALPVLAPRWADYAPTSGGDIAYEDQSGVMVVEWSEIKQASGSSTTITVLMQVRMDCNTGEIEFCYGSPTYPAQSSEYTEKYAVVIAEAYSANQEVIFGEFSGGTSGKVDPADGTMYSWEEKSFIKFTPNGGGSNTPPAVAGTYQPAGAGTPVTISHGGSINVAFNTTVASMNFSFQVTDADNNNCSVTTTITNLGATGIVLAQWQSASTAVPYTLTPTSGTFNTSAGVTHMVTLTVNDGVASTVLSFSIIQAAAAPALAVSDSGGAIAYNAPAAGSPRAFGNRDIAAGPTAAVTITITNGGSAQLNLSSPTLVGADASQFVLNTTGMNFNVAPGNNTTFTVAFDPGSAGSKAAHVEFTHNAATSNPFRFEVTGVGTTGTPVATLVVHEGTLAGPVIVNGSPAAGLRAFGTHNLTALPTAAVTITIENVGGANLNLGTPLSSSPDFTLNTTSFAPSVAPGSSTSFTVAFAATTAGVKTGTITFTHNDVSTASPFTFGVSGTAVSSGGGGGVGGGGGGGGGCSAGLAVTPWPLLVLLAWRRRRKA